MPSSCSVCAAFVLLAILLKGPVSAAVHCTCWCFTVNIPLSLSPPLLPEWSSAQQHGRGGTSEFEWVCPDFFGKPRRETAISENGPTKSHTRECQRFKTLQKSWLFRLEAIASSKTARIPTSLRPTGQQGQKQSPGHLKTSKNRDPKFCSKARGLSSPLKKG